MKCVSESKPVMLLFSAVFPQVALSQLSLFWQPCFTFFKQM